jgi:hypothetical protein
MWENPHHPVGMVPISVALVVGPKVEHHKVPCELVVCGMLPSGVTTLRDKLANMSVHTNQSLLSPLTFLVL